MATITLSSNKINQMPGLIKDVKKSVNSYKSELFTLKSKALTINNSVCNMDDVISSIQSSSQTQEQKADSLDNLSQNIDEFVSDVVRIDGNVADTVNQRKDDFYDEFSYLKPECEKSGWEKFKDGCKKVAEWCKEHWKLIVTIVIVIVAVVLICTGVGGILGAMALGALWGAGIGGIVGGILSAITGGSFWEGFENGAFSGAIAGIISGGMGFAMSTGGTVALGLGKTVLIGAVSGMGSSLIGDLGDKFIKGTDISWGQMFVNMAVSGTLGAAFAGIGYGLSKGFTALKIKFSGKPNANKGPVKVRPPKNATPKQVAQTKSYVRGSNKALKDGALSSTGRVSTRGSLRSQASTAAAKERAAAAAVGKPYQGHAGHVPDTTWTGTAKPHSWLDLDPKVNLSIGGQANGYPIGYKPTKFVFSPHGFNNFNSRLFWGVPFSPILSTLAQD